MTHSILRRRSTIAHYHCSLSFVLAISYILHYGIVRYAVGSWPRAIPTRNAGKALFIVQRWLPIECPILAKVATTIWCIIYTITATTTTTRSNKTMMLTLLDENSLLQVLVRTCSKDHDALWNTCRFFRTIIDSKLFRQERAQQEWAHVES